MPLYIYRCNDCHHEFEVRQRMVDDPLTVCPVCSGTVRRVVSTVGVVFKGSGFYVTDNRTSSVNGGGKSSSSAKSSDSSSETTSKPAPAAESSSGSSSSGNESSSAGKSAGSDSASSG